MGLNDDEEPRLLLKFQICQEVQATKQTLVSKKIYTEKEITEKENGDPTPPKTEEAIASALTDKT